MYKATTYFTSIFSKLGVSNPEIRKEVSKLYGDLVEVVIRDVPEIRRIQVLKFISYAVKSTIKYLNKSYENGQLPDTQMLEALIDISKEIITKIVLRVVQSPVVGRILNEAFLSDIACDIGECTREFKKTLSLRIRIEILQRLKVLINDYNTVQQTELTIRDVFKGVSINAKK
jgi:hypothetical protein